MKYQSIIKGKFVERPNRFVALVEINGEIEKVHVKNTGRCREILIPGTEVYLEDHLERMGNRKLRYSLITAKKSTEAGNFLINMDSQAPNKVVHEALTAGKLVLSGIDHVQFVKREHQHGNSRLDFYLEGSNGNKLLMEVKGVTLEEDGVARFPDAPTERGVKHIEELIAARKDRYLTCILFVVQMKGVHRFEPNDATHSQFGEALRRAKGAGVEILAYDCVVKKDALCIDKQIPVNL